MRKNRSTFIRCPKDDQYPYTILSAKLFTLNGYQLAIMAQILSNRDDWSLVKKEIAKRLGFPERKFLKAWRELEAMGYIQIERKWGYYDYTIYEDPGHTTGPYADCGAHTTGSSTCCVSATLTNTKRNYYYNNTVCTGATCYENEFNELKGLYPACSTWTDGRSVPLNRNLVECELLYAELLKTGQVSHEEILNCLQVELEERKRTGTMQYQPALLKWIKEEGWRPFRNKERKAVGSGYGTEVL